MVEVETLDDIADEIADKLGIYGKNRSFFVGDLASRMRKAIENEIMLYGDTN